MATTDEASRIREANIVWTRETLTQDLVEEADAQCTRVHRALTWSGTERPTLFIDVRKLTLADFQEGAREFVIANAPLHPEFLCGAALLVVHGLSSAGFYLHVVPSGDGTWLLRASLIPIAWPEHMIVRWPKALPPKK